MSSSRTRTSSRWPRLGLGSPGSHCCSGRASTSPPAPSLLSLSVLAAGRARAVHGCCLPNAEQPRRNPGPLCLQWLAILDYVGAPADFAAFLNAVFSDVELTRRDDEGEAEASIETFVGCLRLEEVYGHLEELKTA
ncbi:hypothetical protein OBBRIDRAFT_796417 [Obba rivulosa]|uniref:Uncharacterized protein n=1 Tax=Obba rivulosa TaxID=1052685 RepID=A0A8E2ASL7_9APHY|nr:hypothetical protein OBBRIDRAFT_796417 [Obba rivulosa]